MSHYAKMSIQAQQKFESHLVDALAEHFGEGTVEVHEDKKYLNDWHGRKTTTKANLIVRKDTLTKKLGYAALGNDLGYERNSAGGYDVHVDTATCPEEHLNLIAMNYAERVSKSQMKLKGFSVKREQLSTGEIALTCQKFE